MDRKISCSVCKSTFKSREYFDLHLENVPPNHRNKAFAISEPSSQKQILHCFKCSDVFTDKVDLQKHINEIHTNPVVAHRDSDSENHLDQDMCQTLEIPHRQIEMLDVFDVRVVQRKSPPLKKRKIQGIGVGDDDDFVAPDMSVAPGVNESSASVEDVFSPVIDSTASVEDVSVPVNDLEEIPVPVNNLEEIPDISNSSTNTKKKKSHRVCAVASCKNPQDLKYFSFPPDESLKAQWIHRCRRADNLPDTPLICERHFSADAFLPDIVNRKGKIVAKRLNKKVAIPTEFLGKKFPSPKKIVQQERPQEPPVAKNYKYFKGCVVKNCDNEAPVSSHCFPSDKDLVRKKTWVERCGHEDNWVPGKGARICGVHFSNDSFNMFNSRKNLKKNAVPTLRCFLNVGNMFGNARDVLSDTNDEVLNDFENETNALVNETNVLVNETNVQENENDDVEIEMNDVVDETSGGVSISVTRKVDVREKCAIEDCDNPEVPFFPFPFEDAKRVIAWFCANQKWIEGDIRNFMVCARHFNESDFEIDLDLSGRTEIMTERKKLKDTAVPSKYLAKEQVVRQQLPSSEDVSLLTRKERVAKRDLLKNKPKAVNVGAQCSLRTPAEEKISLKLFLKDQQNLELKRENDEMKNQIKKLTSTNYQKTIVKNTLAVKGFSKGEQREAVNPDQTYHHYSEDEIARAVILRGQSSKTFRTARANSRLSMPCRSTQYNWLKHIPMKPGYQHHSIKMLKHMLENSSKEHFHFTVIGFDEVAISNRYAMEKKTQTIFGNKKKLQMVMARGLVQPWKEPIFYDFDLTMDLPKCKEIIVVMEEAGFKIKVVVFDLGNHRFTSRNGIKIRDHNYYFLNPVDESRRVYTIPDVPHLLKLMRNSLVERGFEFEGVELTIEHFQELLKDDYGELKILYKLTDDHLYPGTGLRKQRVYLAAQLLSNTVAKAMTFGKRAGDPDWQKRAEIITIISNWFDASNSRRMKGKNEWESGFGINARQQLKAICEMERFIEQFRMLGSVDAEGLQLYDGKKTYLWPHGIAIQCKALKELYFEMVKFGPLRFLLTARLNQDFVENYFSILRNLHGDSTKPHAVQAMFRIRTIFFTRDAKFVIQKPNVRMEEDLEETESHHGGDFNFDNPEIDEFDQEEYLEGGSLQRYTTGVSYTEEDLVSADNDVSVLAEERYPEEVPGETLVIRDLDISAIQKNNWGFQANAFLMGFLARKFQKSHPHLGKPTCLLTPEEATNSLCKWLLTISNGRLIHPSEDLHKDGHQFEEAFLEFHACPERVDMKPFVLDRLTDKLVRVFKDKYERKILDFYSLFRTSIRIGDLNKELANREARLLGPRDHKQLGQLQTFQLPDLNLDAENDDRGLE